MKFKMLPTGILTGLLVMALMLSACAVTDQPETVVVPETQDEQLTDQPATAMTGVADASNVLITASSLTDYNFLNIDGEVSGSIQDVIVDMSSGNILYVTVEYGGFLDIGDTELPMPLSAFVWGPGGELVLNFDEAVLESFPDLGTDWPNTTTGAWDDEVVNFWRGAGIDPGTDFTENSATVARVADMIGYGVGDIGYGVSNVDDMLIDLGESRVEYVLLAYDPTVVGDELIAVPFDAFNISTLGSDLTFAQGLNADAFASAPRFSRDEFITGDAQVYTDINNYWGGLGFGSDIETVDETTMQNQDQVNQDQVGATGDMGVAGAENYLVSASSLLDYNVSDLAGSNVGEIQDMLIDAQTGQILFATLEYGGFLDIGDSEVAVPLSAFSWQTDNQLTLNMNEQQLETYPEVDTDWPNFGDATWNDDVVNFWNTMGFDTSFAAQDTQNVMYVSELIDFGLGDIGLGADGSIDDLLIDLSQSQALWAVADYGGLFDDNLIPVPFSAMDVSAVANGYGIAPSVDPSIFDTAPRIERESFDGTGIFDSSFDDEVVQYWEDAGYTVEPF